ncbi:MAG: shikimate kinase [Rhodospirillaceae bacterium]|nr:MAG: shikimate kinase [Rhodospirillaceae bacterium]
MRADSENRHKEEAKAISMPRTVVMVGLMGAGKSTIGRRLATRLRVPFVDADAEIEAAAGCTIASFFARYGETAFRDGERRVMARLLTGPICVLAAGGGAFMDPQTRSLVKDRAVSVWLKADLDVLASRTAGRTHRPLLHGDDPQGVLTRLIDERYPVYSMADITVESTDGPREAMVEYVVVALGRHLGIVFPDPES